MHKSALLATSLLLLCVSAFAKDELKDMSETLGAFQSNDTTGVYFGSAFVQPSAKVVLVSVQRMAAVRHMSAAA